MKQAAVVLHVPEAPDEGAELAKLAPERTGRVLPNEDLDARLGEVLVGWLGTECSLLGDPSPLGSMIVSSIDGS